jgi:hypothetical protein
MERGSIFEPFPVYILAEKILEDLNVGHELITNNHKL